MTASISGILHVNINCEDLEKSRSFYELLGFFPVIQLPEGEYPDIGKGLGVGRHRVKVLMRIGNDERATMLDLLQWLEPQSGGTAARPAFAQGIAKPGFLHKSSPEWKTLLPDGPVCQGVTIDPYCHKTARAAPVAGGRGSRLFCGTP